MNRFRTKKTRDDSSTPRPSQDSDFSMPSFRAFKKGKKPMEEKPQIDLATVLPTNDDFRTSLLMSGLSARFSMLREQDDPNTKIGKASDDSVLFSNRHSRLDYGLSRGLGDIAEVEPVKPPFARKDSSYSDDADSLASGSIMNRAKPTEGNNLFGGRQKIYKIHTGANASKNSGGMSGRALYEDDVAMSAFQRWRMNEKERKSLEEEGSEDTNDQPSNDSSDTDALRPSSPSILGYNKNRETSSTMSSIPSVTRNSTAATSITSHQHTPSFKEGQNGLPPLNTTVSSPALERNVTRTRRLYEQALNQDLQENQTSAVSRFESLSRQRALGSQTPDLAQGITPSPTVSGYSDRFGGRNILTKASAPNLRSISPPATASPIGTPDLSRRVSGASESRSLFGGGAPPLSPPISEYEDTSMLPIQPNDRGKATALGVFHKPSQPYDESRFAQRQLQLQQGRETPTRDRANSNASHGTTRSASGQRKPSFDIKSNSPTTIEPLREERSTLFTNDNASEISARSPALESNSVSSSQRSSGDQHAAYHNSSLATPSSLVESAPAEHAVLMKKAEPVESPTLGTDAGLSGMVRQHLRAVSNSSSVYANESDLETDNQPAFVAQNAQWRQVPSETDARDLDEGTATDAVTRHQLTDAATEDQEKPRESLERDDFANQLADGARRVRERLTMYADNDSQAPSPYPVAESKESLDVVPAPRGTGLGILRAKSSRGSIRERGRELRMLGLGSRGTSPAANKRSADTQPVKEVAEPEQPKPREDATKPASKEEHAGIRAFRQARRELQRMKELEAQNRRQPPNQESNGSPSGATPRAGTPTRERKAPPMGLQQRVASEEAYLPGSRSASRAERERSGSDSSEGQQSRSRQDRPRNDSDTDHRQPASRGMDGPSRVPLRTPVGLPTSPHPMRRSPMITPHPHPASPAMMQQSKHNGPLGLQPTNGRAYDYGQPSPISPMSSPFMSSGPPTPLGYPDRPSSHQGFRNHDTIGHPHPEGKIPRIRPREPSDPAIMQAGNQGQGSPRLAHPNSGSPKNAPPLPPINPRRRQETSNTRTMYDSLLGRQLDDQHGPSASASTPNLLKHAEGGREGALSAAERRRPQQHFVQPDFSVRPQNSNSTFNVGPPASRMVVAPSRAPSSGLPGGLI